MEEKDITTVEPVLSEEEEEIADEKAQRSLMRSLLYLALEKTELVPSGSRTSKLIRNAINRIENP